MCQTDKKKQRADVHNFLKKIILTRRSNGTYSIFQINSNINRNTNKQKVQNAS